MTGENRPYYASLRLRDHEKFRRIRNKVWESLDPPPGYGRVEPHLTVHPGFSVPHRGAAAVAGTLSYVVGDEVRVEGVDYWPNKDRPAVVMLGVSADLGVYRQAIESRVLDWGGSVDREPVPPHVTLFKCRDADEHERDQEAELAAQSPGAIGGLMGSQGGWSTQVSGYTLECRL